MSITEQLAADSRLLKAAKDMQKNDYMELYQQTFFVIAEAEHQGLLTKVKDPFAYAVITMKHQRLAALKDAKRFEQLPDDIVDETTDCSLMYEAVMNVCNRQHPTKREQYKANILNELFGNGLTVTQLSNKLGVERSSIYYAIDKMKNEVQTEYKKITAK